MSASDLKPGTTNSFLLSASQEAAPLGSATIPCTPDHTDEMEPQAVELLCEFFLLLDQWDRENQKYRRKTT
jgi:hypothetical protein